MQENEEIRKHLNVLKYVAVLIVLYTTIVCLIAMHTTMGKCGYPVDISKRIINLMNDSVPKDSFQRALNGISFHACACSELVRNASCLREVGKSYNDTSENLFVEISNKERFQKQTKHCKN